MTLTLIEILNPPVTCHRAQGFAVKLAVSSGANSKKQGNATVGEKDVSSETDSDVATEDAATDDVLSGDEADGLLDPSLYAPGEYPGDVKRANISAKKGARYPGDIDGAQGQGMKGDTKMVKGKNGRMVEKPLTEKQRKAKAGRDAKRKRDDIIA